MNYNEFVKENISTVDGANQREKMANVAKLWREYKTEHGIATVARKKSKKPNKKSKVNFDYNELQHGGELDAPMGGFSFKDIIKKVVDSGIVNKALDKGIDLAAKKYLGGSYKSFKKQKDNYEKHNNKKFYDEMLKGVLDHT